MQRCVTPVSSVCKHHLTSHGAGDRQSGGCPLDTRTALYWPLCNGEISLTKPTHWPGRCYHTQLPDGQIKHWGPSIFPVWPGQAAQEPYRRGPPTWAHTPQTRSPCHQEGLCHFETPFNPCILLHQINRAPVCAGCGANQWPQQTGSGLNGRQWLSQGYFRRKQTWEAEEVALSRELREGEAFINQESKWPVSAMGRVQKTWTHTVSSWPERKLLRSVQNKWRGKRNWCTEPRPDPTVPSKPGPPFSFLLPPLQWGWERKGTFYHLCYPVKQTRMLALNPALSIITLNIRGVNYLIRRQRLSVCI
jgi:hypothetical protein